MIDDEDIDAFLAHYGVKGMQWGVRKKEDRASNVTGLSPQAKLQLGVFAGVVATKTTLYMMNSGEGRRLVSKGKDFVTLQKDRPNWKKNPELRNKNLDANGLMDNVVKQINPGYPNPWSQTNCRRDTFSYEMRRRGNDVVATKTMSPYGENTRRLVKAVGPSYGTFSQNLRAGRQYGLSQEISAGPNFSGRTINVLKKQPNGSRGEFSGRWTGNLGGHSVAWEIVKGKPVIFDCQRQMKFVTEAEQKEFLSKFEQGGITRLDNIQLNQDFLRRWVKNA